MNRKEAIIKLDRIEREAIELREIINEPEKPKPRHADFGINKDGNSRITLFRNGDDGGERDDYCYLGKVSDSDITVFGNVFDLSKEWSEDLTKYDKTSDKCNGRIELRLKSNKDGITHPFGDTPETIVWFDENCGYFSTSEAEEIWHKLGQLIATFKRKENKCS